MVELEKYIDDFNLLVSVVYDTHQGNPPQSTRGDVKYLVKLVQENSQLDYNQFALEKEEVEANLRCWWVGYVKAYARQKPGIHIRQYIIRRSLFDLRDWYLHEMRIRSSGPIYVPKKAQVYEIDLGYLLTGESTSALSALTAYERFLIFLKFNRGMNTLRIAKLLQRKRGTVAVQMKETLNKVRRIIDG